MGEVCPDVNAFLSSTAAHAFFLTLISGPATMEASVCVHVCVCVCACMCVVCVCVHVRVYSNFAVTYNSTVSRIQVKNTLLSQPTAL